MTGLEIGMLLLAAIPAFDVVAKEYRHWRKKKEERSFEQKNIALQDILNGSGPVVKAEYDDKLRRLGRAFQKGDEIGQKELTRHLVILQTAVISLLQNKRDNQLYLIHPNHDSIRKGATSVRDGIFTTLTNQYQRVEQAKSPVTLPVLPKAPTRTKTSFIGFLSGGSRHSCDRRTRGCDCEVDIDRCICDSCQKFHYGRVRYRRIHISAHMCDKPRRTPVGTVDTLHAMFEQLASVNCWCIGDCSCGSCQRFYQKTKRKLERELAPKGITLIT